MKEKIIFKAIVGSQSYGTSTPTSDVDIKGVYMQSIDDLITFGYKGQIEVSKDECYYEVRRFLQLLQTANPTVLELLYSSEDCILIKEPEFDLIIAEREKFLTKQCENSFAGYAIAQIKKAKGLDKKMNWEKDRIERKTPLDFVYVYEEGKTIPIVKFLNDRGLIQENCGLVALNHFQDCYALYYSETNGYRGISIDEGNSVRLSSIPKGEKPISIVNYNKDAYSVHCRNYKDYVTWLEKRNTARYVDIQGHDQQIDGKNLMHCRRLLDTAIEIATQHTINVKRPNAEYLLGIRRGEIDLESIIADAEMDIKMMSELFEKSGLPKTVEKDFVNELLLKIRHYTKNFNGLMC